MNDFLSFRRMITPIFIQVIFWTFVLIFVLGGLVGLLGGDTGGERFYGLLVLLLGPLIVRVYCEIVIIFFRMNETLTDIRDRTGTVAPTPPPPPAVTGETL